ncbi:hypothetical protein C1645_740346 [Glomus cerebriforme]|uniref:Uncharacterized protein n=1 Tax=Glomus cerebriforme TaxID=658196 RepID=A0A397SM53_9GLOM|nr:hypothetical protein C1645_740346 [Glomus cerebriforme]
MTMKRRARLSSPQHPIEKSYMADTDKNMPKEKETKTRDKEKNEFLSVEETYDKTELAGPMLVVRKENKDYYTVYKTREYFWEKLSRQPEEMRCCSETVFADLPQCPSIYVDFSSPTRFPGTAIVKILRNILDAMLEEFNTFQYKDQTHVLKDSSDLVIMDECGEMRNGIWRYSFHILAPIYKFQNFDASDEFTNQVISRLSKEISLLVSQLTNQPVHFVRTLGSTIPGETLHKKISPFSQFLRTNVDIDRNLLFVKSFPPEEAEENSRPLVDTGCIQTGLLPNEDIGSQQIKDGSHPIINTAEKESIQTGMVSDTRMRSSHTNDTSHTIASINNAKIYIKEEAIDLFDFSDSTSTYAMYVVIHFIVCILVMDKQFHQGNKSISRPRSTRNRNSVKYSSSFKLHVPASRRKECLSRSMYQRSLCKQSISNHALNYHITKYSKPFLPSLHNFYLGGKKEKMLEITKELLVVLYFVDRRQENSLSFKLILALAFQRNKGHRIFLSQHAPPFAVSQHAQRTQEKELTTD